MVADGVEQGAPARVLVFAKAPIAHQAKTRLIPAVGAAGAAELHRRMLTRAVQTAVAAAVGPVELWCTPSTQDAAFQQLRARGAFLVSSARRQNAVQFVQVQAESDGVMKLVNPWPEADVACSDPRIEIVSGQEVFEVPMTAGGRIMFHPAGIKPQRTLWSGRPATAPRNVVRVIQEKMPAGHRNDPLQPLVKYADRCTIWLGKPKQTTQRID